MVIGSPVVLDLIPGKIPPVVNVNQYDAGYQKTFLLYKGAEPFKITSNMSVTIRGTKGDHKGIADSASYMVGSNLVSVTLTEQMTAVAGPNIFELRIVDTNGLLVGTVNFVLMVEPAALGEDTVISDSDINYAADVLDRLQSVEAFKNLLDANTGYIFYDNVTYRKYRVHSTDAYVVEIPVSDSDGNVIEPYMAMNSSSTGITPAIYAQENGTTFTCNGVLNLLKTDGTTWQVPNVISRGEVIYASDFTGTPKANSAGYLSINQDRSYKEYGISTTADAMLADGAYTVFDYYYPLVKNGSIYDLSGVTANEDGRVTEDNPQLAIGIKADNTIVMWACDGRTDINPGMTSQEVAQEMLELGCINAWMLDGGGSTSFNWQASKMNRNIDDRGTTDRMIRFTFNIKKDEENLIETAVFAKIGQQKQATIQQIIPFINDLYSKTGYTVPGVTVFAEGDDLHDVVAVGRYGAVKSVAETLLNCPTDVTFSMTVEYMNSTMLFYTLRDLNGNVYECTNHIYSGENHFTNWKRTATVIPEVHIKSNTDLNDILDAGSYYTLNKGESQSLINCPTDWPFYMNVIAVTENIRIYIIYDYNAAAYIRRGHIYSDGTKAFTRWAEMTSSRSGVLYTYGTLEANGYVEKTVTVDGLVSTDVVMLTPKWSPDIVASVSSISDNSLTMNIRNISNHSVDLSSIAIQYYAIDKG